MTNEQKQVRQFMRLAQQATPDLPILPRLEVRKLRARLIFEEAMETINALGFRLLPDSTKIDFVEATADIVEIADGCADLMVVTIGTAIACGIDLDPIFQEVHRSNMSKFIDGHRREDGKWIKGPAYSPPNIKAELIKQGYTGA